MMEPAESNDLEKAEGIQSQGVEPARRIESKLA